MRYDQIRLRPAFLPVEQNIQIQRAWAETAWTAYPPKGRFDCLEGGKQLLRRPGGAKTQGHNLIKKIRLLRIPPGFGFIERAFSRNDKVRERRQTLPGRLQKGLSVSQVGAEANIGGYSLAMRDKASSMRATGTVMAMRKYPSPGAPKPLPGVSTTPVSWSTRVTKAAEVCPTGTLHHR